MSTENEARKRTMTIAAPTETEHLSYTPYNTPISPHSSMQTVNEVAPNHHDNNVDGDESRKDMIKGEQIEESPFTQLQDGGPEPQPIAERPSTSAASPPPMLRLLSLVSTAVILTLTLFVILLIAIRQKSYTMDYPPFPIAKFAGNTSTFHSSEGVEHLPTIVTPRKSWRSRLNSIFEKLGEDTVGSLDEM